MSGDPNDPELRRKSFSIRRFQDGLLENSKDFVATEEPLEIRVVFGPASRRKDRSLSITMRTPGHDRGLAAGFLVGEGIIKHKEQIVDFEEVGKQSVGGSSNQLCVHLAEDVEFDFGSLQRNFYMTSSCGICGMASLEAVRARLSKPVSSESLKVASETITSLPAALRQHQQTFAETGGLHAAGLFDSAGQHILCREDVGRHNALDKLIGNRLLNGQLPLGEHLLLVSGRASFELVQKAVLAGIPILAAVGAPSSLAVELAVEFGLTLIGFTCESRFNVYSHPQCVG